MFRFIRTARVNNAANTPAVMGFATELTSHINKKHDLNIQVGLEMFNSLRVHWHFEVDSLERMDEINRDLLKDKQYWKMLDGAKQYWVDGTMKDTIVKLMD